MSTKKLSARAQAALLLQEVLLHGRSLNTTLPTAQANLSPSDRAWLQAICYAALRELPRYEWLANQLIEKPLKKKVRIIHYLILVGLVQIRAFNTPAHAALSETVQAASELGHKALKGFVNGVLRNYLRQQTQLETHCLTLFPTSHCFPKWLRTDIEAAWPLQAEHIFEASQQQAPTWLRVNETQITTQAYAALLTAAEIAHEQVEILSELPQMQTCAPIYAIKLLQNIDIRQLPGFNDGLFSVQDISAQRIAHFLQPKPGMRLLDACAAPGGKTALLLERNPQITLDALDLSEQRLARVSDNLDRLKLSASILQGDASQPNDWWDQIPYDQILVDAPCSATGILRRQPDIRWHRQASDIPTLAKLQSRILDALWPLLKPGGFLLYATCSILPAENQQQIDGFLARHNNAKLKPLGSKKSTLQILPGSQTSQAGDGFFYALLEKL